MNKKKRIVILIMIFIFLLLLVFYFLSRNNYDKKIEKFVIKSGYKLDDGLYYKQLSIKDLDYYNNNEDNKNVSFRGLYFDISTYELVYDKFESIDGTKLYFVGTYDYKSEDLTYTYRIVNDGSNSIYNGSYDRKDSKLICENEFSYDTDIDEYKDDVCDVVKDNIDDFIYELNNFIINPKFLEYMKDNYE